MQLAVELFQISSNELPKIEIFTEQKANFSQPITYVVK